MRHGVRRARKEDSMKLYYARMTRSARPRWMLEETGAPYELVRLDLAKGDHKQAEYMKIHPHGAVPALVDGDLAMFESAAICAYLADKFPERKLAPAIGTKERGLYYQWLFYAMATMEPPVVKVFLNTRFLPEEKRSPEAAEEGRTHWQQVGRTLDAALAGGRFIVGDQFTAADVMVASIAGWAQFMGLLEGFPMLQGYVKRLAERPAFQRANAD
jgi:glutathione S-transferase